MTEAKSPDAPAPAENTTPAEDLPAADPAKLAAETTPVADSISTTSTTSTESTDEDEPDEETPAGTPAPETANSFKVDVSRALARTTQDGKGDEEPGPSNFEGFATEGVEVPREENK